MVRVVSQTIIGFNEIRATGKVTNFGKKSNENNNNYEVKVNYLELNCWLETEISKNKKSNEEKIKKQ